MAGGGLKNVRRCKICRAGAGSRRAYPSSPLACQAGTSLAEVLIAALVVGMAAAGTVIMFSFGQTAVQAEGQNRVALTLAQQRIEQIRAGGFGPVDPLIPDPRLEASWVDLSGGSYSITGPGYQRQTAVSLRCPADFSLPRNDAGCAVAEPANMSEVKLFTVTVRAVSAAGVQDPQAPPVILQTVVVRR